MKKQNNLTTLVILSIVSTVLTFFAPLAKETTEVLLNSYSHTVSLFSGVDSDLCVALTVATGICFVLFTCVGLFGNSNGKGTVRAGISGIFLMVMQIVCLVQSLNYYDDSSLFGAIISEASVMSIHPLAIVTMVITMITVIVCFKSKTKELE